MRSPSRMNRKASVSRRIILPLGLVVPFFLPFLCWTPRVQGQGAIVPHELYEKADQVGTVRVIVKLQVPFILEPLLPDATAVAAQRQSIAAAQAEIRSALAGSTHRVLHEFHAGPFMGLEVEL